MPQLEREGEEGRRRGREKKRKGEGEGRRRIGIERKREGLEGERKPSRFYSDYSPISLACSILSTCSKGTYLVRYSGSTPGNFTISLRSQVTNDPVEDFLHVVCVLFILFLFLTISSSTLFSQRINHVPYTSEYSVKSHSYPSLTQLIAQEKVALSLFSPAPSSPYAQLRLGERDLISAGYMN